MTNTLKEKEAMEEFIAFNRFDLTPSDFSWGMTMTNNIWVRPLKDSKYQREFNFDRFGLYQALEYVKDTLSAQYEETLVKNAFGF